MAPTSRGAVDGRVTARADVMGPPRRLNVADDSACVIRADLLDAVNRVVQPTHASVWIKP